MKMRFKGRRLLLVLNQEGVSFDDAIIVYRVRDWEIKTVEHGEKGYTYISQKIHSLYVDLWLFGFRIDWTRNYKDPYEKI